MKHQSRATGTERRNTRRNLLGSSPKREMSLFVRMFKSLWNALTINNIHLYGAFFIDTLKTSFKVVFMHNGKTSALMLMEHSVHLEKVYKDLAIIIEKSTIKNINEDMVWGNFKILPMLLGQQAFI
jgi:hypothetical protein